MSSIHSSRSSSPASSPSRLSRHFRQQPRRPRIPVAPQEPSNVALTPEDPREQRRRRWDLIRLRYHHMEAIMAQRRHEAQNNILPVSPAHEDHVASQNGSSTAPSWRFEETDQQRRIRQEAAQLQWENEQRMVSQGYTPAQSRHRTPQDLHEDSALSHARARRELIARLGASCEALSLPYDACAARMRGFDFSNLHGQPSTISPSLGDIVDRRCVQRQGVSATGVPILDFEIDARNNPPPHKDDARTLSV